MAKCVVDKMGQAHRVSDSKAEEIVAQGGYYITKSEHKRAVDGLWDPPLPTGRSRTQQPAHA